MAGVGILDRVLLRMSGVGQSPAFPSAPDYPLSLDEPLLWLAENDPWTIRDACEGTSVIGDTGSGKTTGSGRAIARAFLKAGFGGLVLTDKASEREVWERYCRETGRADALLIVSPREPWRFNFLDYQFERAGEGAGHTENAVATFMNVVENRYEGGKRATQDAFWTDNARRLLRYSLEVLVAAGEPVSMDGIMEVVRSIPFPKDEDGTIIWPDGNSLKRLLDRAEKARGAGSVKSARDFFEREFGPSATRQRSGIVATLTGMADPFLSGPVKELFCTGTNFIPEFSRRGAIILLDLPYEQWEEVGRTAQLLFKYVWQRAVLRRDGLPPGERPVFLWVDEAQTFATRYDRAFQEKARSAVAASVYLTQSYSNYLAALEPGRGEPTTNALLGNLATKIFHRNGDKTTNEWAADTIGKGLVTRRSGGSTTTNGYNRDQSTGFNYGNDAEAWSFGAQDGRSRGQSFARGGNQGWQEVIDYLVPPTLFTHLKSGGPQHDWQVQGVVFKAGKRWNRTGRTYLDVTFPQR